MHGQKNIKLCVHPLLYCHFYFFMYVKLLCVIQVWALLFVMKHFHNSIRSSNTVSVLKQVFLTLIPSHEISTLFGHNKFSSNWDMSDGKHHNLYICYYCCQVRLKNAKSYY